MAKEILVTDEGLKKLNEELNYLKTTKRKEVVEAIRIALSFGDLSENSEYDEAKNEQAKTEARIIELEEMLKHVKLISEDDIHTDSVNVGATVKVYDIEFEEEIEYSLVGSTEADPLAGKISDQSPIGRAIIGAKVGETVDVETPGGLLQLKILEISKRDN
ncbi:MAG: transcription elongation factor GreA [Clostridia bacterium]|nr:transcription elongation factor GreA [Clostridia bacterium]MBQ4575921.1 transcription elongation factor GreA [Clostridia bacterium]